MRNSSNEEEFGSESYNWWNMFISILNGDSYDL